MLFGALVQASQTVRAALDRSGIRARTNELAQEYKGRPLGGHELDVATSQAYWFTIATGVLFTLTWLVLARGIFRAHHPARVVTTVLALVYVFTFVFSGLDLTGPDVLFGLILSAVAIAVVYLLWRRPVTAWMRPSQA